MKKFYLGKISIVDTEFGCFLIKLNEIKVNELNYENKYLNIIQIKKKRNRTQIELN